MGHRKAASEDSEQSPAGEQYRGNPWHAFGYLVAGAMVYGFVGWLLDRLWGSSFVVAVGIVFGAGLGLYMTFMRFNSTRAADASAARPSTTED